MGTDEEKVEGSIVWKTENFSKEIKPNEIFYWKMICVNNIWYEI